MAKWWKKHLILLAMTSVLSPSMVGVQAFEGKEVDLNETLTELIESERVYEKAHFNGEAFLSIKNPNSYVEEGNWEFDLEFEGAYNLIEEPEAQLAVRLEHQMKTPNAESDPSRFRANEMSATYTADATLVEGILYAYFLDEWMVQDVSNEIKKARSDIELGLETGKETVLEGMKDVTEVFADFIWVGDNGSDYVFALDQEAYTPEKFLNSLKSNQKYLDLKQDFLNEAKKKTPQNESFNKVEKEREWDSGVTIFAYLMKEFEVRFDKESKHLTYLNLDFSIFDEEVAKIKEHFLTLYPEYEEEIMNQVEGSNAAARIEMEFTDFDRQVEIEKPEDAPNLEEFQREANQAY
ncbi:hypothetical protein HZY91_08310 [Facklamia sp. DSM 111018]|uniref:Uncharacterized protein n=1 Tax=Facklamia lactis TaxID=2749967 RepID=A0ABS0LS26_9LACT|nr:hypothetical protein [Facklamia lactis]MBG9986888.1 hypothetical protein [Facklamia lactis]